MTNASTPAPTEPGEPHTDGKAVLVTGAISGIGFHTALGLAGRGATVLITGRDQRRGRDAVNAITAAAGHSRVVFLQADHGTVGMNQRLGQVVADRLRQSGYGSHLDVLVNNVGGIFADRTLTADGYEATLAINFLAPAVLTRALLPLLRASQSARCINVTSSLAWLTRQVPGDVFGDLQSTDSYVGIQAHARAKLLTAAWTSALARELAAAQIAVTTVNPGSAWTAMTQALTPEVVPSWRHIYPLVRYFQKRGDPAKAARLCVRLAWEASPAEITGRYFTDRGKSARLPTSIRSAAVQDKALEAAASLEQHARTATTWQDG